MSGAFSFSAVANAPVAALSQDASKVALTLVNVAPDAVTFFFGGWRFPGLETLGRGMTELAGPVTGALVMGLVSLGAFLRTGEVLPTS